MEPQNLYKNDWMKHFYSNDDIRFGIRETYIILNDQIRLTADEMLGRGKVREERQARVLRRKVYVMKLQSLINQAIN